jgi:hypothetical protein
MPMKSFDYVMALVAVVVGLAITHVLSAFGAAIHRMRGHGPPIRLEPVYLLWVGFVLIWVVSFWWWEFKLRDLEVTWSFGLYLFLLFYAVMLYLMVVVLVPAGMEHVHDSYDYFMAGRRWFLGVVFVTLFVDVGDVAIKGIEGALEPGYLVLNGVEALACLIAIRSERRRVQLGVAATAFAYQLYYLWNAVTVLGSF